MNEIFVARNALAATFTSSAVAKSVTTTGTSRSSFCARSNTPLCAAYSRPCAHSLRTPKITRLGRSTSSTANPSWRNSGLHATSTPASAGLNRCTSSSTHSAVPTGTVDLPTIRALRVSRCARFVTAVST